MPRLFERLQIAIRDLDLGISQVLIGRDLLAATNRALSRVGRPKLASLDEPAALLRAVLSLESEITKSK
jgi:hypothetical protein|tara:strand:- start:179 stop:385 length:207 start_codon:yes stop_codon:yes gene_type:complete